MTDFDVIIVGAGLVGASFALALSRGASDRPPLKIALLEASASQATLDLSTYDPRVVALTPHSQTFFQRLKVWDAMAAHRVCPYRDMQVWDAEGTGQIEFNAGQVQQSRLGHIVENKIVLASLFEAIAQEPNITLLQSAKVKQVILPGAEPSSSSSAVSTSVILESGESYSAQLLVAADGAKSQVRSLISIPTREWSYGQKAIVTTVHTENPHNYTAYQRFLSTGPLAFLPLLTKDREAQTRSSIVWSCDEAFADEMMGLDDKPFCEKLGKAFEHRLGGICKIEKRFCIPLQQRHATSYFKPGVALIGDAAHSIHPLAGQGVNLGLLDCEVLAAEILRAKDKNIPISQEIILRRYQRQRKGNNLGMMALMEGFKRLFGSDELILRWMRNEGMGRLDGVPAIKNTIIRQAMGL